MLRIWPVQGCSIGKRGLARQISASSGGDRPYFVVIVVQAERRPVQYIQITHMMSIEQTPQRQQYAMRTTVMLLSLGNDTLSIPSRSG